MINHYVLSFAMYWMHRACHVVPWLWKYVHSIHHWADHPLSRSTYEGATFAPVLVNAVFHQAYCYGGCCIDRGCDVGSGFGAWMLVDSHDPPFSRFPSRPLAR